MTLGQPVPKKIRDKANFYNIAIISAFNKAELSNATGLERTVLAVKNPGFSKKNYWNLQKPKERD